MTDTKEIDVLRLLMAVRKRLGFIIAAAIAGALLMLLYTKFMTIPMYRSNALVYISNKVTYNTSTDSVNLSDIDSSQRLVPVYRSIIKTNAALDKVAQAVAEETGINYTAKRLSYMVSTSQIEGTAILRISVSAPDPEHCAIIANEVATTGISSIVNYAPGSSAYIIDEADPPQAPYAPSMKRNMMLGFMAGAFVVIAIAVVLELFDKRLRKEEDFSDIIGAPVLGVVGEQRINA